jgi:hypothetical protein
MYLTDLELVSDHPNYWWLGKLFVANFRMYLTPNPRWQKLQRDLDELLKENSQSTAVIWGSRCCSITSQQGHFAVWNGGHFWHVAMLMPSASITSLPILAIDLNLEHIAKVSADLLLNVVATLFFLLLRGRRRYCFPDRALANFTISLPRLHLRCCTESVSCFD